MGFHKADMKLFGSFALVAAVYGDTVSRLNRVSSSISTKYTEFNTYKQSKVDAGYLEKLDGALQADHASHNRVKGVRGIKLMPDGGECGLHWSLCPNMCNLDETLDNYFTEIRGNKMEKYQQWKTETALKKRAKLKVLKKHSERMALILSDGKTFSSLSWKIISPRPLLSKRALWNSRATLTKSEKTSLALATRSMLLTLTAMTKHLAWLFPNANLELPVELPARKLPPMPWTLTNKEKPPLTWNLVFISSNPPRIWTPLQPFANLTTRVLDSPLFKTDTMTPVVSQVTSTVVSEPLLVMMMPNANQPTTTWATTTFEKLPRMPDPSRFNMLVDSTNGTLYRSGVINSTLEMPNTCVVTLWMPQMSD